MPDMARDESSMDVTAYLSWKAKGAALEAEPFGACPGFVVCMNLLCCDYKRT